jgi:hypothetical protein
VWLSAFTLPNTPLSFQSPSWGNTGNIGGWDIIPSKIQTISVPAGTFETVLISWGNSGTLSKIWILDNFPFPIKADTFVRSVEERHPEYQFELVSYQQNVAVNPLSKFDTKQNKLILKSPKVQIKNGVEPQNILCKEDLELIFKSTDNSPACVKPESIPKLIERGWAK